MTESDLKKALECARHIQFLLTKMDGSKTVSVEEELIANGIISLYEKYEAQEKLLKEAIGHTELFCYKFMNDFENLYKAHNGAVIWLAKWREGK